MTSQSASERSIFQEAIEIASPEDREAYLAKACGGDLQLRADLDALLAAHQRLGGIHSADTQAGSGVTERVGTEVGHYKLLQQIGEGGFGIVFLAEQERPVRRKVALKIIKPGMDSRQVIARFEAERQALALMDHPNIAKVYDAGATETGRPYFVMELVQGVPITEYCDQCNLTTPERLELFISVCQAVQHAHQKGVIHRDLKPTNVLVTMQDGQPSPKIIDFGVAKAINQQLTEHTLMTAFAQIVGTPLYMSPEQAELSPLGVDTRSDIYSLGVLLYELLIGTTPLERDRLKSAPFDELLRIIREEEPARPSARITTLAVDLANTVADRRRTDARRLKQTVCGDLDWIVMKCLDKDRNRRYETASALAADIRHYLSDEPVSAVAPSQFYRAGKFVRRNKGAVIASAVVLVALVAGIIGMAIGLVGQSRLLAVAERQQAEAQLNLATALHSQGKYAEAEALYRKALRSTRSATVEDRQRTARTRLHLARVLYDRGNPDESEQLYREAFVAYRASFPPGDPNVAHALITFALLLRAQQRFVEAESLFREAYEIYRRTTPADHRAIGESATHLANVLITLGKYTEAERLAREAISKHPLAVPHDNLALAFARLELGRTCSRSESSLRPKKSSSTRSAYSRPPITSTLAWWPRLRCIRHGTKPSQEWSMAPLHNDGPGNSWERLSGSTEPRRTNFKSRDKNLSNPLSIAIWTRRQFMVGRMQVSRAFFAWSAMVLLATPVRAVDFVFQYDDPAGFGFFDPTILPMDTVSVGERRRAALEFAGDIWGRLIRPSYFGEEIVVRAKFDPLAAGTLASAKPHYFYSDFGSSSPQYQAETNYPKALANHLAGRDLAPQRHDIEITVNETVNNFYYLLDGMAQPSQRDFATVAAHELGHGLGFFKSFREGGDYGYHGDGSYHPFCTECLPTPYDRFLTLGQLGPTLISLSDDDAREVALTSTNVYWNGSNGIAGNFGTAPQIDAPTSFVDGSSISHLDPSMFTPIRPILMAPGYMAVQQSVSTVERGIMRDLGWNVSVTPSAINWTGLGADDNASTPANWSTAIPLPGDSLAFGASPRTDVNMDVALYSIGSLTFAADAPAYTVTFDRQKSTDITVGVANLSSQAQKIVVENGFANSPDRSGATLTFKSGTAASTVTFEVLGGGTDIESPPNLPPRYVRGAGGRVVFEGNARAGSATFTVEGGRGAEGPQGMVIFRGGANGAPGASAGSARFHNKGGRVGVRLPAGFASGYGGETRFEGNSNAGTTARFRNDGEAESIDGTGGITTFTDDASAGDATFENFGVPQGAGFSALGGFTRFLSRSSAGTADFINYESAISNTRRGMGETQFWGDAKAGTATFTNMGGTLEGRVGGVTRFYGRSTAENGTFTNLGGGFRAGATEFYEDARAGSGRFLFPFNPPSAPNPVGSGRTDFFDRSVASAEVLPRAEYTFEGAPPPTVLEAAAP